MEANDSSVSAGLTAAQKWSNINDLLWETISNSEGLEHLCQAQHENDWEYGLGLLIDEIIHAMGEGNIEPWTREDRIEWQKTQLRAEIERAQTQLDRLNK